MGVQEASGAGPVYPGVGLTETQYVDLFSPEHPLTLASGAWLPTVSVAYETYGTLDEAHSNAIFICHALTGDAHAAGWHEGDHRPGWWDELIGPGKAIDTNRWFVVSPNILGGCQGTTGPSSINPATGEQWGLDFPLLQMRDFVTVHRELSRYLGITRYHGVAGGSLGGMQVLQWALDYPEDMASALVIAASSRLTAQNIAFSAVGRQSIMADEHFYGGQFAARGETPRVGLSVARMMAHITYLSEQAFAEKFGRNPRQGSSAPGFGADFAVESYLDHQGEVFLDRFDALSYLYLSRVMDYFDPFEAADSLDKLRTCPVNFLVMSFDSDWRFATSHSRRIVRELQLSDTPVTFRAIAAPWGHDSFLMDIPEYSDTVRQFLRATGSSRTPPDGNTGMRADLERIGALVPPGSKVLDLGCGEGELLAYLIAERGCSVTGVERDSLAVLSAVARGVPVVEWDIDSQLSEFPDGAFDVVVLSRTLQALLYPAEVLTQMKRIGRRLIVTMPNFGYWRHRSALLGGHMPRSKDLPYEWYDTPNLHHSTLPDLELLFSRVGLKVTQRIPLSDTGEPLRFGGRGANLLAGSVIYVLVND
jgi:homoserine O-acetyltransferase